jgi:cell surface protein SprA
LQGRVNTALHTVKLNRYMGRTLAWVLLFVGISLHVKGYAQSDSVSTPYKVKKSGSSDANNSQSSNIDLDDPVNVTWKYNPKSNRYEAYKQMGSLSYPTGESLSVTEYFQKSSKETNAAYQRQKSQNTDYSQAITKGGITEYIKAELGNPAISKIFGAGGVDFQLTGSAMVKLGGTINEHRNPNFSKRQQKYFVPVFDQQLQIAANGNIGEFVKLGINYDTEAQFDFDNQTNLGWKGKPDGILKDVQVGNVNLNLPTQLIKPANNLFGFANTMQFGKTTIKTVFSQNRGQSTETVLKGGAQMNEFRITGENYDQNRHFFLSQFFRDNYDRSLENLPIVASGVIINRVEVWVTNRNANVETPRDILCFMDLGESKPYRSTLGGNPNPAADNTSNVLFNSIKNNEKMRRLGSAIDETYNIFPNFEQTVDFDLLNYARQLKSTEYTLNTQLGYISLMQPLNNDEILAVAFEYTYNGITYQVGEFSRDIPPGDQRLLYLKMLKGTTIRTQLPIWDLMMKNIYSLNTYSLSLEDFKFNVIYADDTSGADYNYLPVGAANLPQLAGGIPLIRVLGLDNLNRQQEAKPDGIFDAIEGITIEKKTARVIFPVVEPFGDFLRKKFENRQDLADYYCFDALYDSTKFLAKQDVKHNKFFLQGSFKSSNGAELMLGTTNLKRGSVRVTANGRPLQEGMDYEVDYAMGRVRIINQGLLQGGAEIRASADGQSMFNIQQKTLLGGRVEHKYSKNLQIGGTLLHMYERPLTSKTNFNEEPILNTIFGADLAYSSKSRFLTKLIDKLPFIETKEISNITAYAEFARIIPGNHRSQGNQRGVSNLEDFEAAELQNDFKVVSNWTVASIPQKQPDLFPETSSSDKFQWLNKHAKLSYYTIDQLFYRDADMPPNVRNRVDEILSNPYMRQIDQREVFPERNFPQGSPTILPTLDLAFDPYARGMYNFNANKNELDSSGRLLDPKKSWAGIMRRVDQNDFEAANIDYVEIWLMDPLMDDPNLQGELLLHLGNVSEDILPDRRKSFENGLPTNPGDHSEIDTSQFGYIATNPQINFAFDNNPSSRELQDLGLDGLNDQDERAFFDSTFLKPLEANFGTNSSIYQQALADPANDNFLHYLEDVYNQNDADIVQRYSKYQGMQGNNSTETFTGQYANMPKSSSTQPDYEDINRDFTMNQSEDYYQYKVKISAADLQIGRNYVADIASNNITLRNGRQREIKWYQLKIPILEFEKAVGNISDFKSIRFMRMVMTQFNNPAVMRFGYINLVRADWRRYTNSLKNPGVVIPADPNDGTKFIVSTVNLEENSKRSPIAYVTPPGIERVQNMASLGTVLENEQALSLLACNLMPGDAKGAFKTVQYDVRNYARMQLFLHAEEVEPNTIEDGEVSVMLRFGTDLTNNYYEYEVPLKMTRGFINANTSKADVLIWPEENKIDLEFQKLFDLKIDRQNSSWPMTAPYVRSIEKGKISVMGLPDLSNIRVMMIGIKNNSNTPKCFEIWANELRVKDIANGGGWAALANLQAQLADFGQLNMAGSIRTIGFGDVDKKLNDRSLTNNFNYDIATNLELGKFFPASAGVSIPMYLGWSESFVRPKFNPLNPDIQLENYLAALASESTRESIRKAAEDYNSLFSFNINNFKVASPTTKKPLPWSISNFNGSYSYQSNYRRNQQIEEYFLNTTQATLGYAYALNTKFIQPFKFIKNKHLQLVRDFNFNFKPSSFTSQIQLNRLYGETQARNNNNFVQLNPRLFDKNFTINRNYNLAYPLTRSININYAANLEARIQEPTGRIDNKEKQDSILAEFKGFGRTTRFYQSINATYTLPFSKISLLKWITASATYNGSFEWRQAPPAFTSLGNVIQNSQDINITSQFNFTQLYNQIPWLRDYRKPQRVKETLTPGQDDDKDASALKKARMTTKPPHPAKVILGDFLTMFKNANVNINRKENTQLPGYAHRPDYFGFNFRHLEPGVGFIFGMQDPNARFKMAESGSLLGDVRQANFFQNNISQNISGNVTIEPIKDFRIRVSFLRNETKGIQSIFKYDGTSWMDQGLTETGTYSISGLFVSTHFTKDISQNENHPNPVFDNFLANRYTVAERLQRQDPRLGANLIDTATGFPTGYSKTSQDVILGGFYAAYSGMDVGRSAIGLFPAIPMPNWNIDYNGLSKLPILTDYFSNINIKHAYKGTYTVGNYQRNLKYDANAIPETGKDFVPLYQVADVTITEGFSPLIGLNVTTKNNWTLGLEYKRNRILKLFASSFNLTEMRQNEFTLNAGYRVAGLTLPIKRKGRRIYLPNDFRFDLAVSISDNTTIIRKIDVNMNRYTAGMLNIRINPSINYQINQKINMALRYNRNVMNPKIATQFYTALTDFGIEMRYTFN